MLKQTKKKEQKEKELLVYEHYQVKQSQNGDQNIKSQFVVKEKISLYLENVFPSNTRYQG